jgi:hypothetical protein
VQQGSFHEVRVQKLPHRAARAQRLGARFHPQDPLEQVPDAGGAVVVIEVVPVGGVLGERVPLQESKDGLPLPRIQIQPLLDQRPILPARIVRDHAVVVSLRESVVEGSIQEFRTEGQRIPELEGSEVVRVVDAPLRIDHADRVVAEQRIDPLARENGDQGDTRRVGQEARSVGSARGVLSPRRRSEGENHGCQENRP